jgi:hypothetical protein
MSLHDKIIELLPEIDDIEDTILRERVIATWLAAARRGEWKLEQLEDIPYSVDEKHPLNLFDHVRAVSRTAVSVANSLEEIHEGALPIDHQRLIAASLLIGAGKLLEFCRDDKGCMVPCRTGRLLHHPISGAVIAAQLGLPEDILHILIEDNPGDSSRFKTVECIIIQHADRITTEVFNALS